MAGLATGAQALVLLGALWHSPAPTPTLRLDLLPWAAEWTIPDDRDRFLYLAGIVLSSALGFAYLWAYCRPADFWSSKRAQALSRLARDRHIPLLVPSVILAAQWAVAFLNPHLAPRMLSATVSACLLLADLAALGIEWALPIQPRADLGPNLRLAGENNQASGHAGPGSAQPSLTAAPQASKTTPGSRAGIWHQLSRPSSSGLARAAGHAVAVLAIGVLLYVPDYPSLTGRFLGSEGFHHWDYFAAAPIHAYLQGLTPGLESISQYGLGIPVILGSLFKVTDDFSYANLVWLGIMIVICYYLLLYLLLWLLLKHYRWAITGLLLALLLQQFSGLEDSWVLLQWPSSTIMRAPLDVSLFIVLVMHARLSRRRYLALGGLLVGLAAFWETDTGIYLYTGYVAYCGLLVLDGLSDPQSRRRRSPGSLIAAMMAPPLAFACLVFVAVGENVLNPMFWERLSEPMRRFSAGFGMLPMPTPEPSNLFIYLTPAVYIASCVAALASAARLVPWRWEYRYIVGSMGVYGLAMFNQYVGRSHPWNWYHVSIPLVILLVVWAYLLYRKGVPYFSSQHSPTIVVGVAIILLASHPPFQAYPNLLASQVAAGDLLWNSPGAGFRTSQSVQPSQGPVLQSVEAIQNLIPPGGETLVLSHWDTLYYVLSDRRPLTRFVPLYPQVTTWAQSDEVVSELGVEGVDYVFTEPCWRGSSSCFQVQSIVMPVIEREFVNVGKAGDLLIWRRGTDLQRPVAIERAQVLSAGAPSLPDGLIGVAAGQVLPNGLELLGYRADTVDTSTVSLLTVWRVAHAEWAYSPHCCYNAFVHVYQYSGEPVQVAGETELPLSATWRTGDLLVAPFRLSAETPLGRALYRIEAGVYVRWPARAPLPARPGSVPVASLGLMRLGRVASLPAEGQTADFGNGIRLASGTAGRQGSEVDVKLVWEAKAPVPRDYTVFAHLYNDQGQLVAQRDGWPVNGNYPTSAWLPGEYVAERRPIPLPSPLAPGAYTVKVGLYDAKTMERLLPSPEHGDRSVLVGRLEVAK